MVYEVALFKVPPNILVKGMKKTITLIRAGDDDLVGKQFGEGAEKHG